MDKLNWIKDLVLAEQQMEDSGVVDMSAGFDPETELSEASYEFLQDMKTGFTEAAATFNQFKGSSLGTIKIYGIAKTKADFMLFRNGAKLVFSLKQPGLITVSFGASVPQFIPGAPTGEGSASSPIDQLEARWGAYGELQWTSNGLPIKLDFLVRYYMTRFVKESSK